MLLHMPTHGESNICSSHLSLSFIIIIVIIYSLVHIDLYIVCRCTLTTRLPVRQSTGLGGVPV